MKFDYRGSRPRPSSADFKHGASKLFGAVPGGTGGIPINLSQRSRAGLRLLVPADACSRKRPGGGRGKSESRDQAQSNVDMDTTCANERSELFVGRGFATEPAGGPQYRRGHLRHVFLSSRG